MRFGILGPLEVRDGRGRPVAVRHPAERRLLLRLLAAGGEPVRVDRLARDLAGDGHGADAAVSSLFDRIGALRRRLEPDRGWGAPARVLLTTAGGYALGGSGLARDDREAAGLAVAARAELAAGRAGAAGERAAEALALWRGPALADAGDARWADAERRRLAALAGGTRLVAVAALALDRPGDARAALEEAQSERPHDGRLWALRAATELALERDVEALRVLRRARLAIEGAGRDRGPLLRAMEAAVLRADHQGARALCLRVALDDAPDPDLDDPVSRAATGDGVGREIGTQADPVSRAATGHGVGREIGTQADPVPRAATGDGVGREIGRLPGRCRRLVELLALAGASPDGEAGIELLARAAGLPPASVVDQLDPAVTLGLVTVSSTAARFRHPTAAPAVLSGLTPFRLRCAGHLIAQASRYGSG